MVGWTIILSVAMMECYSFGIGREEEVEGAVEGIGVCQESSIMKEVVAGIGSRGLWAGELLPVRFEEEAMEEKPNAAPRWSTGGKCFLD
jgi:hypothetical protein